MHLPIAVQTFSSAPTATGRFWLSVNLSVFYSPNKIILLFNIKHRISGRNLILLIGDRSSCAGGWKKGGREKQGELCNRMATATSCWGGHAGCSSDANARRGDSNHLHSLPLQYRCSRLVRVSLRTAILLCTCSNGAHSVHSCADIGILFPKTRH